MGNQPEALGGRGLKFATPTMSNLLQPIRVEQFKPTGNNCENTHPVL